MHAQKSHLSTPSLRGMRLSGEELKDLVYPTRWEPQNLTLILSSKTTSTEEKWGFAVHCQPCSFGLYDSSWQLLISVRGKKVQSGRVLFPPWNKIDLTGQVISRDMCYGALNYPITPLVNPTSMLEFAINIYLYRTDHLQVSNTTFIITL